uniref:Uncharacterized protein n=1 Tax=Cacopsylla melanoneura TaxID=428564 RepID=A0A8D9F3K0_9HEMI
MRFFNVRSRTVLTDWGSIVIRPTASLTAATVTSQTTAVATVTTTSPVGGCSVFTSTGRSIMFNILVFSITRIYFFRIFLIIGRMLYNNISSIRIFLNIGRGLNNIFDTTVVLISTILYCC